jgi:DNA-binding response OmpR family regulator
MNTSQRWNGINVLLVEDNDCLREATLKILQSEGFSVFCLSCAEDVDDEVFPWTPDVYIIDLNLPGEDGLSLSARLRRAQPNANIVMTTARTKLEDRVRGYENGADVYLAKPVDPAELISVLRAYGKRTTREGSRDFTLELDIKSRILKGSAGTTKVSLSEANLLLAMSTANNQTLERWQVMAKLSNNDQDISAESLQNRISQLRRKLVFCSGQSNNLEAVRSVGYQLTAKLVIV